MSTWKNYLAGVSYACIFGFSFLMTKDALVSMDPFELLFLRFLVAALAMSALVAFKIVRVDYRKKPFGNLATACILQPILYFACETLGVRESATSTAGIILGAMPASVAILGALMLKERLTKMQALCLGLSVIGVAFIVLSGSRGDEASIGTPSGIAFLVGAVVSASFYNIYSRKASASFSPVETTFAMMWTGALSFGILALLRGDIASLASRAISSWSGILYLGLLSSIVAFFCVNYNLSKLTASQSIVFANLTTVVAVAVGIAFRGESFGIAQAIGTAMIIIGVWGTNATRKIDEPCHENSGKYL